MNKNIQLKEIAEIKLSIMEKSDTSFIECLSPAHLEPHNVINGSSFEKLLPQADLLIQKADIIIKRVNPFFVNYVENIQSELYTSNNLFLIRINSNFSASYIAFILNEFLQNRLKKEISGSTIFAINRKILDNITIPLFSRDKQEALGNAWLLSNKKLLLAKKLSDLEYTKELQLIKKYTFGEK